MLQEFVIGDHSIKLSVIDKEVFPSIDFPNARAPCRNRGGETQIPAFLHSLEHHRALACPGRTG